MSTNTAESGSFSRNFHLSTKVCVCVCNALMKREKCEPKFPNPTDLPRRHFIMRDDAPLRGISAKRAQGPPIHLRCSLETSSLSSPHILGVPNNKPPMEKEGKEARSKKKREAVA